MWNVPVRLWRLETGFVALMWRLLIPDVERSSWPTTALYQLLREPAQTSTKFGTNPKEANIYCPYKPWREQSTRQRNNTPWATAPPLGTNSRSPSWPNASRIILRAISDEIACGFVRRCSRRVCATSQCNDSQHWKQINIPTQRATCRNIEYSASGDRKIRYHADHISGTESDINKTYRKCHFNARDTALRNQYLADIQRNGMHEINKPMVKEDVKLSKVDQEFYSRIRRMLEPHKALWNGRLGEKKLPNMR